MRDVNAVEALPAGQMRVAARPSFAFVAERHLDDVYRYLLVLTRDPALAEISRARRSSARCARGGALIRAAPPHARGFARWRATPRSTGSAPSGAGAGVRGGRAAQGALEQPDLGLSPALEQALSTLSAADREVIALRVVLDLDPQQAARLLGVSVTACTTRLNRALKRLEERLNDDD